MSIRTEAIRLAAQRYKDDDCLEAFIDGAEFGSRRAERSFEDFSILHSEWSYWARKGRPEQGAESLWGELCDRDAYAALSWISESLDAMKYIWPRLGKKIPEPSWMALTDRKRNEELARKAMSDEHVRIARNEAERIMSDIELSISDREAKDLYPTQYWEGTKTKRSFDMTTDDLQDAYMRGREAEPCEEQVEAVAKYLADTSDGWNTLTEADREPFRETAAEILQVARKAVM